MAARGTQPSSSFASRVGPLMLARAAAAALTFAIPLVLARRLSLADYGTYKQLILVAQTLYYVVPFGVPQALYFFLPRSTQRRPFVVQTLLFLTLAGVGAALALQGALPSLARHFSSPGLLEHRTELSLYLVGLMGSYPLEVSLTAQGRTRQSALVYLLSDGARAAVMTLPVLLGAGVGGLMQGLCAFSLLRLVVAWAVLPASTSGPSFGPGLFRQQLRYALPFGAAVALNILQGNAHQYVVGGFVSPEAFSLYAVGCFQLPFVDLLYTPTSEVLMVRLGELDAQGRAEAGLSAFRRATAALAFAFFPAAAFLAVCAPQLIALLFGERFLPAAPLFRVGVLSALLAALPVDGVLRARGRTRHILFAQVVKVALTVPLLGIGVPRFGMMGGITAWVGAEAVGKLVLLWRVPSALSSDRRRVRLGEVLPWRQLGQALAGSVAAAGMLGLFLRAALGAGAVPQAFSARLLVFAAAGAVFGLGYALTLFVGGVRPAGLRAVLPER